VHDYALNKGKRKKKKKKKKVTDDRDTVIQVVPVRLAAVNVEDAGRVPGWGIDQGRDGKKS
jgi:hypothetical protein